MSEPRVLLEKENFIILEKPPGWVVSKADTVKNDPILQNWLETKFDYEISKDFKRRSGIVHRIDKDTSGIIVVAKNTLFFDYLQKEFQRRNVKKSYIAMVHGIIEPAVGEIFVPLARLPWNRKKFGVLPGGKEAITKYEVKSFYKKGNEFYSLLNLFPKTGRTHQIRVHLKYIAHPIVSDPLYAGRKTYAKDKIWCPRLFLHASSIEFIDLGGKVIKMESPLYADLANVLKALEILSK